MSIKDFFVLSKFRNDLINSLIEKKIKSENLFYIKKVIDQEEENCNEYIYYVYDSYNSIKLYSKRCTEINNKLNSLDKKFDNSSVVQELCVTNNKLRMGMIPIKDVDGRGRFFIIFAPSKKISAFLKDCDPQFYGHGHVLDLELINKIDPDILIHDKKMSNLYKFSDYK